MSSNATVVGNLTRDPELRFTPNGTQVATFGVAVNRRWRGQNGDWQENVSFFNVTCWNDLAQNVSDTLQKGTRVLVSGRLEQRSWETQQGEKRSTVEIVADEVGPSLRWASAEIRRNERREGGGADNDQWGGGGGAGGAGRSVSNEPPAAAYDPTEEPF